jgi:hypothetical protein
MKISHLHSTRIGCLEGVTVVVMAVAVVGEEAAVVDEAEVVVAEVVGEVDVVVAARTFALTLQEGSALEQEMNGSYLSLPPPPPLSLSPPLPLTCAALACHAIP